MREIVLRWLTVAFAFLLSCGNCRATQDSASAVAPDRGRPAASDATEGRRALVQVLLEVDGREHGRLTVGREPIPLEGSLPAGVKPLTAWTRIHAVSDSGRFALVVNPATDYAGQVPMLYVDSRGEAVFAMVGTGPQGALPKSLDDLKRHPTTIRLPGVLKLGLWIDVEPRRPETPESVLVLRCGVREVTLGAGGFGASLGPQTEYLGEGIVTSGGGERPGAGNERPMDGEPQEGGKTRGTPLGWSVVQALRARVLGGSGLLGVRVIPATGEPVPFEPRWWTEKDRFLGIRVNRRGQFVVHGYVLGERARAEIEVRDVQRIEAVCEGAEPAHRAGATDLASAPRAAERRHAPGGQTGSGIGGGKGTGDGRGRGGGKGETR